MTEPNPGTGDSRRPASDGNPDSGPEPLRARAETRAGEPAVREEAGAASPEETRRVLHELRVHQIELEIQNEELRRTQAELAASRERYFELYDLAPVGYCTVSEAGLVVEANLTAAALLNVARGALTRQPFARFILQEDGDVYYLKKKRLFETGEPQVCELRMLRAGGPPFWARLQASAARDPDGQPVCRVVLSDVSERRNAEEDRGRMRAQMHQAEKLEALGRLAGGVAHDFNNMLGVILGHAEMLLDRFPPGDPLRHHVAEMERAARRSADLTRRLLAFSRKQVIVPRVLDLNETISGIVDMLRRLIGEHIDLQWKPGPGVWPVKADPSQIDQVLANLAVNARDAIAGTGTLTIETANAVPDAADGRTHAGFCPPGKHVLLTVSDTGAGMDQATLERAFEPFFTTKDVGKGTGLGLATVYGIVKQNNGQIHVQSESGRGSTFRIYLPRADGEAAEMRRPTEARNPRGHETVLLVEDEPSLLNLGKAILERHGYAVLAASGPAEALRMAGSHPGPIHLLITDVIMPEMNGQALRDRLGAVKPGSRCLFMSGYTGDMLSPAGVLDERIDFLQKPFSVKELTEKVRDVLEA